MAITSNPLIEFGATSNERVMQALSLMKQGRPVLLVDDEDRENEGDLIFAAETITPKMMALMIRECSGIVCLCLTQAHLDRLELPQMVRDNGSRYGTAFTVSIEAKSGVTTGVSAADRVRTIQVAIDDHAKSSDLARPGHVFPLRARDGGVLARPGHTEGSVDLARLAGLKPAAVLCELMNPDGTMARLPEIISFAREQDGTVLSIADIVDYRLQHEPNEQASENLNAA